MSFLCTFRDWNPSMYNYLKEILSQKYILLEKMDLYECEIKRLAALYETVPSDDDTENLGEYDSESEDRLNQVTYLLSWIIRPILNNEMNDSTDAPYILERTGQRDEDLFLVTLENIRQENIVSHLPSQIGECKHANTHSWNLMFDSVIQ